MITKPISKRRRNRLFLFALSGMVIFLLVDQFYTAINYLDPDEPHFSGQYAVETPRPAEVVTVVSYNVWFGLDIEQALSELRELQSQKELDIILLQEMDEVGAEQIARGLKMNYVYFPAAVEPTYKKNFGNAVLSRWPIVDAQKLILPHKSLSNRMNRIATRATIRVKHIDIVVYSTHTESIFTLPQFREDQYTAILNDIDPQVDYVIAGGDFNSFLQTDISKIEESFSQAGFVRVSEEIGATVIKRGIEVSTDHIFAKGFVLEEAGKVLEATASDHLPIWVTLRLK